MNTQAKILGSSTVVLSVGAIIALLFLIPPYLNELTAFAVAHPVLAPFIVIFWRVLAIVIPPLPGGILSYALIPVFGWFWSYVYHVVAIALGASIAFWLARRFRDPLVKRFVPLQQMHEWEGKLTDRTEFFAFLGIRLTTAPVMDFISYAAGLSKMSYKRFLLATLIADIPDIIVFYLGETVYKKFYEQNPYIGVVSLILFLGAFYLLSKKGIFPKKPTDKK